MKTAFIRLERRFTGDYRFRQLEMEDAALCWRFVRLAETVQVQNDQGLLANLDGSAITPEQLAINEGCKPEAVEGYRRCLERCQQLGLLEQSDGGTYRIPQWEELWSCARGRGRYPSEEPDRVRQRVAASRAAVTTNKVGNELKQTVTDCNDKTEIVTSTSQPVTTVTSEDESVTTCNECNESLHDVTSYRKEKKRKENNTNPASESIASQQPDARVGLAVARFERLGYLLSSNQLNELARLVRGSPIGLDAVQRVFDEHQDAIFEQRKLPAANRSIKRPIEFLFSKFPAAKTQLEEASKAKSAREFSEREESLVRAVKQLEVEVARGESILSDPATGDEMRALVSRELRQNRASLADKAAKLAQWMAA